MNALNQLKIAPLMKALAAPEIILAFITMLAFSATIIHPENILPEDLLPGVKSTEDPLVYTPAVVSEAASLPPNVLMAEGKVEEAIKKAYELTDRQPHDVVASIAAGNCLLQCGQLDGGFRLLKRSVALAPRSRYVRMNLAEKLFEKERYEESATQLRLICQGYPRWVKPRLMLADIYMKTNNPGQAAEELKAALESEPSNVQARKLRGIALARAGKGARGLEEYFMGESSERNMQGLPSDILELKKSWGSLERAVFELNKDLEMHPDDVLAKMRLARIYMYAGQNADAKRLLQEARKKAPANAEVHRNLALVLHKLGEESQALSEFLLSVKLELAREKLQQEK